MAYQLSDLISEVRTKAKDSTFLSDLITYFLQDTQDEVLGQRRLSFLEEVTTETLVVNATSFTYDATLQSILGLTLKDPDSAAAVYTPDYVTRAVFDQHVQDPTVLTAGQPSCYTDYGHVLYWDRPLDKAYVMRLRYLRRPITLTNSTDVPDVPVEYKNLLIRGALAGVEEYRENYDIAAVHRRKVEDLAEDMFQRYSSRQLITTAKATLNRRRRSGAF